MAALKAICEMRVDRDDLRGVVDAAAAGPGRKKKADRGPDPPTLEDFRRSRHPRCCCIATSPYRPQIQTGHSDQQGVSSDSFTTTAGPTAKDVLLPTSIPTTISWSRVGPQTPGVWNRVWSKETAEQLHSGCE